MSNIRTPNTDQNETAAPGAQSSEIKSGFVAVIGRPNSGKSTLVNTVLGEHLCVVTSLPQTTRRRLRGIYTAPDMQLVFVDTPGVHRGDHSFNEAMIRESREVLRDEGVDVVAYVVDLYREFGEEEDVVAGMAKETGVPVLLVFNKADMCPDPPARIAAFFDRYPTLRDRPSITISAIDPAAGTVFLDAVTPLVPVGPKMFPDEDLTDANLRFFAAEYLQKSIILSTREEVPHAACVEILDYKEKEGRHVIQAAIHVETKGQRGILIGKRGVMITRIRERAERDMQELVGVPVSYHCHIRVTPKWRDNARFLREMGW